MELVRIAEAVATVTETPGILVRMRQSLVCRCRLCLWTVGRNFEQLLSFWKIYSLSVFITFLYSPLITSNYILGTPLRPMSI